ncbi:hypothetical protein JCM9279_001360 [Rhodotorula babjevae]
MDTLLWTAQRRTTLDARDAPQDALVGFSSGASTDDDGLPHTPPDLPFLAPALKASPSSQASSRASSRSRPPSTVLELALAESSLAPFSHRDFSRSPSPPPSPQLSSSARQSRHRSLPAGFEHIPWISDDDDSDVEGRLSRSLSPPLHDLLSLPPLSPDVDERDNEAKLDGDAAALSPASTTSDLPPSPPRTPSPRRRFASLSGAAAEHDLPWATSPERAPSSPERSRSSPSPRRRSSTRSGLPTLRSQLSPPHPSPPATSSPTSRSAPSSSPDKPVRPTLLRESSTTSTSTSTTTSRRPALPISQAPSPPPSPRARAALQLPTPDDVRARHAATRSGERGRARAAEREAGAATGASAGAGDGLQLSFPSAAVIEAHEREGAQNGPGGVAAAHGPIVEDGSAPPVDEADPHSLDYFERHCHSLSLLRLRHALSVATVLASLPPSAPPSPPSSSSESEPSPSRAASSRARREPLVAHVPGLSSAAGAAGAACASSKPAVGGRPPSSRPSSSSTPLGAGPGDRSMVSQQYRLYAMGRAKAQRTGGVGYWEGGLAAWELLLMD